MLSGDPIGNAIQRYSNSEEDLSIRVECDLMEDDFLPVPYLFRSYELMPEIEKVALRMVHGHILDAGAAAGPHTRYLRENGYTVTAIDISKGAISYLNAEYPTDENLNVTIEELIHQDRKFDSVLLLMNGIGLAEELANLEFFLSQLKSILNKGGKIICDSTDVRYFYEDEDGSVWVDLNTNYHGDFKFRMHFENSSTDWFKWLYVDPESLQRAANNVGLSCSILYTDEHTYLAELREQ